MIRRAVIFRREEQHVFASGYNRKNTAAGRSGGERRPVAAGRAARRRETARRLGRAFGKICRNHGRGVAVRTEKMHDCLLRRSRRRGNERQRLSSVDDGADDGELSDFPRGDGKRAVQFFRRGTARRRSRHRVGYRMDSRTDSAKDRFRHEKLREGPCDDTGRSNPRA